MSAARNLYSKILLFGEYSVIQNSMALSLPYPLFEGHLTFKRDNGRHKDAELMAFARHLKKLEKTGGLDFDFDLSSFSFDIGQGIVFDSTIPQGHGVGSSGALCAAIYERYGVSLENNTESISELMRRFSLIEAHFHGSSSGLDPLISYLNKSILVESKERVGVVNLPQLKSGPGGIFLLNTGRSRKTEPLVNLFLEKCKSREFNNLCTEKLLPITNNCITRFLEGDINKLGSSFRELSSFQLNYFTPMIPKLYQDLWKQGLSNNHFHLKLCGAGGGGFLLGMTSNFKKVQIELEDHEIRPLFRF